MRIYHLVALSLLVPCFGYADTLTYDTTIFSTNLATGAVGMRGSGTGNLTVSGIPAGATATQTNLYWHGPTNSSDPAVNSNVTVGGQAVSGTSLGFASDNFWASQNSQAYQANVTSIINGNGTYALSNFQKANAQINGAAAFVFYDSGLSTGKDDVILYHGNDSNFASPTDVAGWNFTASNIDYSGGSAFLTLYVSDGQNFGPNDDGTLTINGTTLATGGIFQGIVPGPSVGNGTLTDIVTFNLTPYLNMGLNNLNIQLTPGNNDALSLVAAAFVLPAGSAPPTQEPSPVPEPGTLSLIGTGLAALTLLRNRVLRQRSL